MAFREWLFVRGRPNRRAPGAVDFGEKGLGHVVHNNAATLRTWPAKLDLVVFASSNLESAPIVDSVAEGVSSNCTAFFVP